MQWESRQPKRRSRNRRNGLRDRPADRRVGDRSIPTRNFLTAQSHAMERFTPIETLSFAAIALAETVETVEREAVRCEITAIEAQIAQRETRLALIRYRRSQLHSSQSKRFKS
ncbi:MAG: hypothetical protein HC895_03625 [Leptolyngbyaceae cyanobacterium SM1_3_5]|nr:hypothetical protein [Leptolyngbyaceae cyanobacterium SM1_3_5]